MDLRLHKLPCNKMLLSHAKKLKRIYPNIINYSGIIIALGIMFCYLFAVNNSSLLLLSIGLIFLRINSNKVNSAAIIKRNNTGLKDELVTAFLDRYSDTFIIAGITLSTFCSPITGILGLASMFLISHNPNLDKVLELKWEYNSPLKKVKISSLIILFSFLQYLNLTDKIPTLIVSAHSFAYFEICMILLIALWQIKIIINLKSQYKNAEKLDLQKNKDINNKNLAFYDDDLDNTEKIAAEISDSLCADLRNISKRL